MVSIKEVAKHAGVAISTVSKVLNGYPNVSEETKKKVQDAIKELNYIPNSIAAALSSKQFGRIALVLDPNRQTQAIDQIFMQYLVGALDKAKELNVEVVTIFPSMIAGMTAEEITRSFLSQSISGVVIYLTVRRAWHTENNRPVILDELKTKAAHRNIPLPVCLADCLKETKANSQSEYVVSNRDGDPLSYTQFKRLWQYIVTRTVKERFYYRYEDGKRVKHTVTPVLGEKAAHNGKVIYSLDFEVTPHTAAA